MSAQWQDNYSIKATLSSNSSSYESQFFVEDIETHDCFLLRVINIATEEQQDRFKNEITCLRAISKQRQKNNKLMQELVCSSSHSLRETSLANMSINSNHRSFEYNNNTNKENNKDYFFTFSNSYHSTNNSRSSNTATTQTKQYNEQTIMMRESQQQHNTIMQLEAQSRFLPQLLQELPAESIRQRVLLQNQASYGTITLGTFLSQHNQSSSASQHPSSCSSLSTRKLLHYFLQIVNAKSFMHSLQIFALFTNLDSFVYSHTMDAFIMNQFENTTADVDKIQAYFKDLEKKNNNSKPDDQNSNNNNNNNHQYSTAPSSTSFYSPQQRANIRFSPEFNEIYALGGILHFMLFGCVYTSENREKYVLSNVPLAIKDILQGMLHPQENLRPSLADVVKMLEKELSPFFRKYSQLISELPSQQESKELIQQLSVKRIGLGVATKKNKMNSNNWRSQQQQQQQQQKQSFQFTPTTPPPVQVPANSSNILRNDSNIGLLGENMTESFPRGTNSNVTVGNDLTILADQASWIQGCQGGGLDSASYNQTISEGIISFSKHMDVIDGLVEEQSRKYIEIKEQIWQQQQQQQLQQQQQSQQLPLQQQQSPQLQQPRSLYKKLSFIQFYLNKLLQFITQSAISYILLKEQSIIDDSNNFLLQSMKQAARNHQSDINPSLNFELLRQKAKSLAWQQPIIINTINNLLSETDNPSLDLNYFMTRSTNNNNNIINDSTLNTSNILPNTQLPSSYNTFSNRSTVGTAGRSSLGAEAEQASRLYQFNTRNPNTLLSEFIKHSHGSFQMGDRKQFNAFLVALYRIGKYFEKDNEQTYSGQLRVILEDIYAKTRQLFFERSDTDASTIVLKSNMYYASQVK